VVTASAPLREASLFHEVLASLGDAPVLAVIVGALVTWASSSTLSIILLIASFLANGSLDLPAALALVLGLNLGGGLPALSSTAALPREARRLPIANLACRGLLAIALIPLLPRIQELVAVRGADPVLATLAFHFAFNALLVALCLPLAGPIMRGFERLLPGIKPAADTLASPRYLDHGALDTPSLALSNAQYETARMTELLDRMVETALGGLKSGNLEDLKSLRLLDEKMNGYQAAIHGYLAELMQRELEPASSRRAMDIMLYVSNLEHAGDVIELSLADRIRAKVKEQVDFSARQAAALFELGDLVRTSLRIATSVLAAGDMAGAKLLIEQKGAHRAIENRIIAEHFNDQSHLRAKSLRASALYVDIIRDLHTLNSHIVSCAYPIADREGLLHETRLREQSIAAK
jgi:phosphate:Na+ symporter